MTTSESTPVPELRLRAVNTSPIRPDRRHVLYWMTAARRSTWNYGLDRAIGLARSLDRPLVVLEALRVGYRWASDRFHRFVIDGMADNEMAFHGSPVAYHPYVEPEEGAGSGLLERLAGSACVVVTDDFPAFFLPGMVKAAGSKLDVRLEAVDSNGLLPMQATEKVFSRAFDFRRFLQRELEPFLSEAPLRDPLAGLSLPEGIVPDQVEENWPRATEGLLDGGAGALAGFPIDHSVPPVEYRGGAVAGSRALERFLSDRLSRYLDRNQPLANAASGLSPWLHFGHVSAHQVFSGVAAREEWWPGALSDSTSGKRTGWWGMSEAAESFLDELVTWRELGFNLSSKRGDYDRYESLPEWARLTLEEHALDRRPYTYTLEQFERAETHDSLWNAAQNQLRVEGRIHNYLRMLWGKKILHWTEHPRDALAIMIELNNKYAVDGRDPNSYSGIFWVLGRYDRAWGPEREIFGKIRYMTSDSTRRKLKVKEYTARWTGDFSDSSEA